MLARSFIITEDGSHSLFVPELKEHYHSTHGALQESKHVFIDAGLKQIKLQTINVLEVGMGTGLNAFLTMLYTEENQMMINYYGIEKYPLTPEEYQTLNYAQLTSSVHQPLLVAIHESEWNTPIKLTSNFHITKIQDDITTCTFNHLPCFDLVYFDAFAPNKQAKVWDKSIFKKIVEHCNTGAIFVTYCAKGVVRRDLQEAGFRVERIQGPPGKNEMIRGFK